jgi:hypothetical protein
MMCMWLVILELCSSITVIQDITNYNCLPNTHIQDIQMHWNLNKSPSLSSYLLPTLNTSSGYTGRWEIKINFNITLCLIEKFKILVFKNINICFTLCYLCQPLSSTAHLTAQWNMHDLFQRQKSHVMHIKYKRELQIWTKYSHTPWY